MLVSSSFVGCNVLRGHVEGEHESVRALELETVRALAIGLKLVRHHHESVIARRSPVFNVLEHRGFIRHALKALEFDLGRLAPVQGRMGLILVKSPGVDVALGGLKRFPFYGKHVPQNLTQALALPCRCSFVECD